mgnify:FL=1
MTLLLMALMAAVTVHETTLDLSQIEDIDGTWTAPGYRLIQEAVIDPLDYGEPLLLGNDKCIGCNAFFVDTPEGEKWRVVLTFPDKVVKVQEDEEIVEYPIAGEIMPSGVVLSENGSWAIILLVDDNDFPPYYREPYEAVMINLDNNIVKQLNNIYRALWLGNSGTFVSFDDDSVRFYNENHVPVAALENFRGNTMARNISFAGDGSLLVEGRAENSDYFLRAYDESGNTAWESPGGGLLAVSADGERVFAGRERSIACLDGNTGELRWSQSLPFYRIVPSETSIHGVACAFYLQNEPSAEPITAFATVAASDNEITINTITCLNKRTIMSVFPDAVSKKGDCICYYTFSDFHNYPRRLHTIVNSRGELITGVKNDISREYYLDLRYNSGSSAGFVPVCINPTGNRFSIWNTMSVNIYRIERIEENE